MGLVRNSEDEKWQPLLEAGLRRKAKGETGIMFWKNYLLVTPANDPGPNIEPLAKGGPNLQVDEVALAEELRRGNEGPFGCWECQYIFDYLDLDKYGEFCGVCGRPYDEYEKLYEALDEERGMG